MTDKEIIIDGVDVSGCEFVEDCLPSADCKLLCGFCYEFKNCYYKQLQHEKQDHKHTTDLYNQALKDYDEQLQIISEIEKVIAPYQEPFELNVLSLPTAIESILERLQKDSQNFKRWYPIISRLFNKCGSYNHAKGLSLEQYALNLRKELDSYKQALEIIKNEINNTPRHYWGQKHIEFLEIINEVLKDD